MTHLSRLVLLAGLTSFACSEETKSTVPDAGTGGDSAEAGGAKGSGGAKATGGATSGGANAAGSGGKSAGSGGRTTGAGGKAAGAGGSSPGTGGRASGGAAGSSGKAGSGGSAEPPDGGAIDAGTVCVTYCKCMAMNCASQVFAAGCLKECAAGTKWDMACRQNMCSLVPVQPDNNHCVHAFGVNECLDKP
jgi:hypothetical protein